MKYGLPNAAWKAPFGNLFLKKQDMRTYGFGREPGLVYNSEHMIFDLWMVLSWFGNPPGEEKDYIDMY